jgi:hypothetical protein
MFDLCSIGLNSGCVYGKRLSALVIPKSSPASSVNSTTISPLSSTLASTAGLAGSFRHFDKNSTLASAHPNVTDPFGSPFYPKAASNSTATTITVPKSNSKKEPALVNAEPSSKKKPAVADAPVEDAKPVKMTRRARRLEARGPPPRRRGWNARSGLKGWEPPAAEAAKEAATSVLASDEDESKAEKDTLDEVVAEDVREEASIFEERRVVLEGREGWVVSVDCSVEASARAARS